MIWSCCNISMLTIPHNSKRHGARRPKQSMAILRVRAPGFWTSAFPLLGGATLKAHLNNRSMSTRHTWVITQQFSLTPFLPICYLIPASKFRSHFKNFSISFLMRKSRSVEVGKCALTTFSYQNNWMIGSITDPFHGISFILHWEIPLNHPF
jgi:hypothetical protein